MTQATQRKNRSSFGKEDRLADLVSIISSFAACLHRKPRAERQTESIVNRMQVKEGR